MSPQVHNVAAALTVAAWNALLPVGSEMRIADGAMISIATYLSPAATLPVAAETALLAGRLFVPSLSGPAVVKLEGENLSDLTHVFPTMRDLCEADEPAGALRNASGK